MLFKTQLISCLAKNDISIENAFDDYSENESEKEGKEAETKLSKSMEDQKWVISFDLLNNSKLTFSNYIRSSNFKGLPSVSIEIETPPPDFKA